MSKPASHSLDSQKNVEILEQYIVMGSDASQVQQIVADVGGEISHSLELINSVGAYLTHEQRQTLANHPQIQQVLTNSGLSTSKLKYSAKGAPELDYGSHSVSWQIANLGKKKLSVENISLAWPEANGDLLAVEFDDAEVYNQVTDDSNTVGISVASLDSFDVETILHKKSTIDLRLTCQDGVAALADD